MAIAHSVKASEAREVRSGTFRKMMLTSLALAAIAFQSEVRASDSCAELASKSKVAAVRCEQGNQDACREHFRLIAERVEKCESNEQAPKPKVPAGKTKR
ncbi:MAG: hypothetical protein N3H30_00115 [Candidatus Micrarchaeota archaeon]|nr:hypothetical protein [Candidatus Micrarchaeota archaeon]